MRDADRIFSFRTGAGCEKLDFIILIPVGHLAGYIAEVCCLGRVDIIRVESGDLRESTIAVEVFGKDDRAVDCMGDIWFEPFSFRGPVVDAIYVVGRFDVADGKFIASGF